MDYSQFADLPLIDGHVHFVHQHFLGEMLSLFELMRASRAHLVCIPNPDATNHNPAARYFKKKFPDMVYISGALSYQPLLVDAPNVPELLAAQITALKASGFDGFKLIEGKPEVRKLLPYSLDGPLYDLMWRELEREAFPVVFHVGDPDEFWDAELCPEWAKRSGWDYSDGSFPSKENLYSEVDHILERYPNLKITFPHFFFLSRELERAGHFLDDHPNVCFDLAPHIDMYRDFSNNVDVTRAFFVRYQDRIIYGTDLDTRALDRGAGTFMRFVPWLIRSILEQNSPFLTDDGVSYHGLGLPQEVLEKIYYKNFERVYGPAPVPLNDDLDVVDRISVTDEED